MPRSTFTGKSALIVITFLIFLGCVKDLNPNNNNNNNSGNNSGGNNNVDSTAAITPIGTPVGNAVTQLIGPAGGTIKSGDGKIELTIPAGALNANTNISIQPVSNTSPGGIGLAYDLLPNGTQFNLPATFTFHYSAEDIDGTDPLLLFLAFQDSSRAWDVSLDEKDVDTTAKTVSFDIHHFTIFTIDPAIRIVGDTHEFKENESGTFEVRQFLRSSNLSSADGPVTQPSSYAFPSNYVSNWKLSGGSADGTLLPTGNSVYFQSPSLIDPGRTTQLSVQIQLHTTIRLKKAKIIDFYNKIVTTNLKLIPSKMKFMIDVEDTLWGTSTVYNDRYIDGATFEVEVDGNTITYLGQTNQYPSVSPASGSKGNTKADWVPDQTGICNITGVSGGVGKDSSGNSIAGVLLLHIGTIIPKWHITNPDGTDYLTGGTAVPGAPASLSFIVKDSVQSYIGVKTPAATLAWKVTPEH